MLYSFIGWVLEKHFGIKAWDYSNEVCNLKGWVCLKFSVFWGLLGGFVIYIVHPAVSKHLYTADQGMKLIASLILLGFMVFDVARTIFPRLEFVQQLKSRVSLPLHLFKM